MEAIVFLQDFVFTAFLTLTVYFILSKLLFHLAEYGSTSDGIVHKAGFLEQIRQKLPEKVLRVSGLRVMSSDEKEMKGHKVDDHNAVGISESGFVEELFVLPDELKGEKECVGVGVGVGGGGSGSDDVECSRRPILDEIQVDQGIPVAKAQLEFDLGDDFEVKEAKNDEGVCGNSEGEDSEETKGNALENNQGNDHQGEEEGLFDDWEGIERTELEERFDAALAFVESKSNADLIDGNLRMQFYGLQRLAMEGPCLEPQPLALRVSARAKWNAWQKLGNMSGDMAMEQYIDLLSKTIPKWEDKE